jgi:hypothetical protein
MRGAINCTSKARFLIAPDHIFLTISLSHTHLTEKCLLPSLLEYTMNPLLRDHLAEKIRICGNITITELRTCAQSYRSVYCPGLVLQSNAQWFPSDDSLSSLITRVRNESIWHKNVQKSTEEKVRDWTTCNTGDFLQFLTPQSDEKDDLGYLLFGQTSHQYHMMERYSKWGIQMDSTFGTNRHQFSLFFIMGRNNFRQGCSLAFFLIDGEDERKITRALNIFKSRMKVESYPRTIVTDCCLAEINALFHTFPKSNLYLCKFHVRQAWKRNLSRTTYAIPLHDQDIISCMLAELQDQTKKELFIEKRAELKKHAFYSKYRGFFSYFENEWGDCVERWAYYCRVTYYANMTTTNFCESFNKTVKSYLGPKTKARRMRLDMLLDTLLKKVFPAEESKYRSLHENGFRPSNQIPVRVTCA